MSSPHHVGKQWQSARIIHGASTIDRQAGMGPGKNLRAIIEESLLEEWEPCFDNNDQSIFKPVSIETPSGSGLPATIRSSSRGRI